LPEKLSKAGGIA